MNEFVELSSLELYIDPAGAYLCATITSLIALEIRR